MMKALSSTLTSTALVLEVISLVNCSPDLVWRMTPEGVFTFFSRSLKTMSGYEPHELVGLSVEEFGVKLFTDESRQKARAKRPSFA